ncbi:MAG: epoxyqueuosine reductase QueH, partial [Oscillospiraceae bacterium]
GYDYFTTTLSISPYKNADKLNEIGEELAEKYNIKYLTSDFKKKNGYRRSCDISREYGMYRQNYCGCVFSMREREEAVKHNMEGQNGY